VVAFILNFATYVYIKEEKNKSETFHVYVSFIPPLTLTMTMTVLYMFIFELKRIKLILQAGENFDQKLQRLYIIRGICIFLTFVAYILVGVNNFDFLLP
jgi:hypothetical protein